jgi:hypothetical protein
MMVNDWIMIGKLDLFFFALPALDIFGDIWRV